MKYEHPLTPHSRLQTAHCPFCRDDRTYSYMLPAHLREVHEMSTDDILNLLFFLIEKYMENRSGL
jgi:hypothetical protein